MQSLATCDITFSSTSPDRLSTITMYSNPITLDLTPNFVVRDDATTLVKFEKYSYPIAMNGKTWLWHDYRPADVQVNKTMCDDYVININMIK